MLNFPDQRPWVATSSAPWPLEARHAPDGAPPFVIEPERVCTTLSASSVRFLPSTRTLTRVPAPDALVTGAATSRTAAPLRARTCLNFMRATPFHEGVSALRRLLVSWLTGLPSAPSRRLGVPSGV